MKKIIGLVALLIAIGMLIMLIAHNRLVGLIIIALLKSTKRGCRSDSLFPLTSISNFHSCQMYEKAYALSTLPDLKQRVQTCILLEAPFTLHLTRLTFAFHIALVFLFEWLTL